MKHLCIVTIEKEKESLFVFEMGSSQQHVCYLNWKIISILSDNCVVNIYSIFAIIILVK
jgi:hypothetical protein